MIGERYSATLSNEMTLDIMANNLDTAYHHRRSIMVHRVHGHR